MEGFCPGLREGRGGWRWGRGWRGLEGVGGSIVEDCRGGVEGIGEEERPHKYSRGALNGEREIKQMEFVLKNSTITLF